MKSLILLGCLAFAFAKPALKIDPMNNEDLFEGDIYGIDPDPDRNAVADDNRLWPEGRVPYIISPELESLTDEIRNAMDHIEYHSCVRFVEKAPEDVNYVKIFKDNGCYSHWGRTGGEQRLSLGDGCSPFGTIVHELMHAIGFEHEHNRSDRDDYLTINWDNIQENFKYAFRKLRPEQNRLLTQFDFGSIMLYGSRSFAKEYDKYSMVRIDGLVLDEVYNKKAMSVLDKERINTLYKCPTTTTAPRLVESEGCQK